MIRSKIAVAVLFLCLVLAAPARAGNVPVMAYTDLLKVLASSETPVLVNFWATWCGPCRLEIPLLQKLAATYDEKQLKIIGVSVDQDANALNRFVQGNPLNYSVYLGDMDMLQAFRVSSIPHTMVYKPKGKRIFNRVGLVEWEELVQVVQEASVKASEDATK